MYRTLVPLFFLCLCAGLIGLFWVRQSDTVVSTLKASSVVETPLEIVTPTLEPEPASKIEAVEIPRNSSFFGVLASKQIPATTLLEIVSAAKSTFDLSKLASGTSLSLQWLEEQLQSIKILFSLEKELAITLGAAGQWTAVWMEYPVSLETQAFSGVIHSSLWDSAIGEGLTPELIDQLAGILGWQIDFARELHPGDEWSLLVEKRVVQGQDAGLGVVLAAEVKKRDDSLVAIRFESGDHIDYYDLEGKNLRGKFLKSPLKYSRISSRFSKQRFHPILKVSRPHLGVDYAAAEGTPIHAVGDGRVTRMGHLGGAGNMIKLHHNTHYMTAYKHLSAFAKGVHVGQKIRQGDVIGYVGQTGLASAPHLHFEFYEKGHFMDPLGKRFPREKPVEAKDQKRFLVEAKRLASLLWYNSCEKWGEGNRGARDEPVPSEGEGAIPGNMTCKGKFHAKVDLPRRLFTLLDDLVLPSQL